MKKPCVFFDRDGIVNVSPGPGYVERLEDFHLIEEFFESLEVVNAMGYEAVIVTNQRGVARNIMTQEVVDAMHRHLREVVRERNLRLTDIYVCPHERETCECRKPKPGMLLQAAEEHALDLARSWMIGDSETDVEAGRAAGCRTVLVSDVNSAGADFVCAEMGELPSFLQEHLEDLGAGH